MFDTASLVYNALLKAEPFRRSRIVDKMLGRLWHRAKRHFHGPVTTVIHGKQTAVNFGYTYPVNARRYATYNNPLIELAYQTHQAKKSPLVIVDVGAAVGDTVLFLRANCGQFISRYVCVDGDKEFLGYLRENLGQFDDVTIIPVLLSEANVLAPTLERTHSGTASAQGTGTEQALTFDDAVYAKVGKIDLIKIDVDGFDGRILSGAKETLTKSQPSVIFEWHPILYKKTNSDLLQPFHTLWDCGYRRYVWFNKYGEFSHFSEEIDAKEIDYMQQLCVNDKFHPDWHYDVVALPSDGAIDPVHLAECQFARSSQSRY